MTVTFRDAIHDAAFARDGALVTPMLTAAEVAELRALYDRYPREHATAFSATILSRDLDYRRAVHEGVSAVFSGRVAALFHDYRVFMAGFLSKQPSEEGSMPLHQDLTLVGESARPALSIWCPLVDVTAENGCVEIVFGSHAFNSRPRAAGTPFAYPELEPVLRARSLRPAPVRAGEALFLHHSVFHASSPNRSMSERPVAVAVLAPREAPLVYFHRVPGSPPMLEEYAVDEEFYLRHAMGTRPPGATPSAIREEAVDPLEPDRLIA